MNCKSMDNISSWYRLIYTSFVNVCLWPHERNMSNPREDGETTPVVTIIRPLLVANSNCVQFRSSSVLCNTFGVFLLQCELYYSSDCWDWVNAFPQISHLCHFSPVWINIWIVMLLGWVSCKLAHLAHCKNKGVPLVCACFTHYVHNHLSSAKQITVPMWLFT